MEQSLVSLKNDRFSTSAVAGWIYWPRMTAQPKLNLRRVRKYPKPMLAINEISDFVDLITLI